MESLAAAARLSCFSCEVYFAAGGLTVQQMIDDSRDKLAELCRVHHVRRLSVFGSYAREDFNPETSDVDLLVEFDTVGEMDYAPNYFDFLNHLDELFGRRVDLISDRYIRNPYFRREVEKDKVLLYAA